MFRKRIFLLTLTLILIAASLTITGTIFAQGNGRGNHNSDAMPGYGGAAHHTQQQQHQLNCDSSIAGFGCNFSGNMNGFQNMQSTGLNLPAASDVPLSDAVITAIRAGIADEFNAFNMYQAAIDQFGSIRPFTGIQSAEAQHISAWTVIFERYGIDVPDMPVMSAEDTPVFASITDACQTAADAEIANFSLYDHMLETVSDYPDIVQVVTTLRNASEFNHLPALERCAAR